MNRIGNGKAVAVVSLALALMIVLSCVISVAAAGTGRLNSLFAPMLGGMIVEYKQETSGVGYRNVDIQISAQKGESIHYQRVGGIASFYSYIIEINTIKRIFSFSQEYGCPCIFPPAYSKVEIGNFNQFPRVSPINISP